MPISPVIPALRFPDPTNHTGIMDLYLVVLQIIAKAEAHGATPLQVLSCVLGLLNHTAHKMEAILEPSGISELLEQQKVPRNQDSENQDLIEERGKAQVRASLRKIQAAVTILDDLHSDWFTTMRVVEELSKVGVMPAMDIPDTNHHLLSDEICESLGLNRDELEVELGIKD
jgi:hypothetical protein